MYCNKCGTKLDDDAQFCVKCGAKVQKRVDTEDMDRAVNPGSEVKEESQEAQEKQEPQKAQENQETNDNKTAKKKINGKIIAILAGIVVIAVCVFGFLTVLKSSSDAGPDPKAECNYNNGANFAYDDSRIYFIGLYNDTDTNTSVYSTTINGTDKKLISDNKNIKRIRVYDDLIVYVVYDEDNYLIGMMNKDGSNDKTIVSLKNDTEDYLTKYDIGKKTLYYLYNKELHSCNWDGGEDAIIESDVDSFVLAGKKIYYTKSGMILVYDTKKEESQEICSVDAKSLVYDDGVLYFSNDNGIYYVPVEETGAITKVVKEENISDFMICGDDIYFVQSLSTEDLVSLAKYMADKEDEYLDYALAMIGVGQVYKVDKQGMQAAELVETSELLVYTIYSAPDDMYCKISVWSNEITKLEIE